MEPRAKLDIYDPDFYVSATPHAAFAELRRTDPVQWNETLDSKIKRLRNQKITAIMLG